MERLNGDVLVAEAGDGSRLAVGTGGSVQPVTADGGGGDQLAIADHVPALRSGPGTALVSVPVTLTAFRAVVLRLSRVRLRTRFADC